MVERPIFRLEYDHTHRTFVATRCKASALQPDPVIFSRVRHTYTPSQASKSCRRGAKTFNPYYPSSTSNPPTISLPHVHQEAQPHAYILGTASFCNIHWQELRITMAGRRSCRAGFGRDSKELEEKWRWGDC